MPFRFIAFVMAAACVSACSSSKPELPPERISISITDFEARAGVQSAEAETVADALGALLTQTGRFTVVDRKQIQAVLQEQGFQQAQGLQGQAAKGNLLVVRKFITGSLSKLGDNYILNVKMTDVESSRIDLSLSRTYDDDLEDIMDEFLPSVAMEILTAIDGKRPQ